MAQARLDQEWTDGDGITHPAGSVVEIDDETLVRLVREGVAAEQWPGPTGAAPASRGWVGPTADEPADDSAQRWVGPTVRGEDEPPGA
jgi:hypothetical protein